MGWWIMWLLSYNKSIDNRSKPYNKGKGQIIFK